MSTTLKLKKLDADVGKVEVMNALGATLGFAPSADSASFVALFDEKIDAQKAELAKLAGMRDTVARLLQGRRRGPARQDHPGKPWTPGADTLYARVLDLLRQHGILTRLEIANLLSTQAAGEVPLGSVSSALSKLAGAGRIEGDRAGWRLGGADTGAVE